jgi:hypothetical protein
VEGHICKPKPTDFFGTKHLAQCGCGRYFTIKELEKNFQYQFDGTHYIKRTHEIGEPVHVLSVKKTQGVKLVPEIQEMLAHIPEPHTPNLDRWELGEELICAILTMNFLPRDITQHGNEILQQIWYEFAINNVRVIAE